jgi:hypothetical protein
MENINATFIDRLMKICEKVKGIDLSILLRGLQYIHLQARDQHGPFFFSPIRPKT